MAQITNLNFGPEGLIPVAVQDEITRDVLVIALYCNA